MINNELKTAFRWYDNIDKQNRYKNYCAATCDYKLITPLNSILPFEIKSDIDSDVTLDLYSWKIYCSNDNTEAVDLSDVMTSIIFTYIADGIWYFTNSGTINAGMSVKELPCGSYYSVLEVNHGATIYSFYSEIFTVIDFQDNSIEPSVSQFPLFTAWRWYDNIDKQNRYKSNCSSTCDYVLISPQTNLLPFQFRLPIIGDTRIIDYFKLIAVDGSCEHNIDFAFIEVFRQSIGDYNGDAAENYQDLLDYLADYFSGTNDVIFYDYFYYNGNLISDLPCGRFYGVISLDGLEYYSELIDIIPITVVDGPGDYILQESGFKLLQETGFGLLTEQ